MPKTKREIENPLIVRMNVKDRDGTIRKISISPVLFSTLVVLGRKQPIPVKAEQIIKQIASRLSIDDTRDKMSFSRLVQDEIFLCILELVGGDSLKDAVVEQMIQKKLL